jgi:hypothetical protein
MCGESTGLRVEHNIPDGYNDRRHGNGNHCSIGRLHQLAEPLFSLSQGSEQKYSSAGSVVNQTVRIICPITHEVELQHHEIVGDDELVSNMNQTLEDASGLLERSVDSALAQAVPSSRIGGRTRAGEGSERRTGQPIENEWSSGEQR